VARRVSLRRATSTTQGVLATTVPGARPNFLGRRRVGCNQVSDLLAGQLSLGLQLAGNG
jgi:hypothetical protein